MTRNKLQVIFGLAVLLLLASSASAQVWTAVASSGAIDESHTANYAISDATLFFRSGAVGNVAAVYNVTNPRDNSSSPFWTTLEFTVRNPGGGLGNSATAILYRVPKGSATALAVCSAVPPFGPSITTTTCTFSSSLIDFNNNYYFVRISLGRTATQSVAAYGVRIY